MKLRRNIQAAIALILLWLSIYILYLIFRSWPIDPEITLPVQEEPVVVTTGTVELPICEVHYYEIIPIFKQNKNGTDHAFDASYLIYFIIIHDKISRALPCLIKFEMYSQGTY